MDKPIECKPDLYVTYMVSTLMLIVIGVVFGHISQNSWKLFKNLMKFYLYLCLPCLAVLYGLTAKEAFGITIDAAGHNETDMGTKQLVLADCMSSFLCWGCTMVVSFIIYKYNGNHNALKHGALAAQFIIHGCDLGFGYRLISASFTGNKKNIELLTSVQIFTTLKSFLIFFPLTNSFVCMSSKQVYSVKTFVLFVCSAVAKLALSYVGIIVGVMMKYISGMEKIVVLEEVFMLTCTFQVIAVGVYLYHIVAAVRFIKCGIKTCLLLMVSVTILYPLLHLVLIVIKTRIKYIEIVLNLGHSTVPSSLYLQYYILNNTKASANYILAFVGSIFSATILMYVTIFSYDAIVQDKDAHSPLEYFEEHQRDAIQLFSLLMLIPAAMVFCRRQQSKLRTMLLFMLISNILFHMFEASYGYFLNFHYNPDSKPYYFSTFASCVNMIQYSFSSTMAGVLRLYWVYAFVGRKWKIIVWAVSSCSILFPVGLHCAVVWYCESSDAYPFGVNVFLFLDVTKDGGKSIINIGSTSYCLVSVLLLTLYIVIIVVYRRRMQTAGEAEDSRILIRSSEPSNNNILDLETGDAEKYIPIKIYFYYNLTRIIFILFGTFAIIISSSYKNFSGCVLFVGELIGDLTGPVFALAFCITPGTMEKEFERFMYLPRSLKYKFQTLKPVQQQIEADKLTIVVIDRCRRFVLYHKPAFINLYEMIDGNSFKGLDLIRFLIKTDVADTKSEAIDICNSYLEGGVFRQHVSIMARREPCFLERHRYTFTDAAEVPDFGMLLRNSTVYSEHRAIF